MIWRRLKRIEKDIHAEQQRLSQAITEAAHIFTIHGQSLRDLDSHRLLHCGDIANLQGSLERLLQFCEDAVNAAGAAQRFWDVLVMRNRIPEQELKELGEALDRWQRSGRLN